jgi:hypothetical protein
LVTELSTCRLLHIRKQVYAVSQEPYCQILQTASESEVGPVGGEMIAPPVNCRTSKQRILLLFFLLVNMLPAVFLRLVVDPPYLLEGETIQWTRYGNKYLLAFVPAFLTWWGVRQCAPGATKWQVQAFLGPPRFKETKVPFPGWSRSASQADEIWIYETWTGEFATIGFRGDRCVRTSRDGSGILDGCTYATWKTEQLTKGLVGLPTSEIENKLGHSFLKSCRPQWSHSKESDKETLAGNLSLVSYWKLYVSGTNSIELKIKDARCVSADSVWIFY